jgi:hypothetical protein
MLGHVVRITNTIERDYFGGKSVENKKKTFKLKLFSPSKPSGNYMYQLL